VISSRLSFSISAMRLLLLLSALLWLMAPALHARTISWFNAPGDVMVDASNNALGADITFEIGTFGAFVPTAVNLDEWAANWKVFDRAVSGDGWNLGTQFLTSSAQFRADGTSSYVGVETFMMGDVMYLWAYTAQDLLPTSQWALVRDDSTGPGSPAWTLPASDTLNPTSIDWDLIQADTAIFGGVNGTYGGGDYIVMADPGFVLQLATVPEPGGAFLAVLGLLFLVRRRR
jgi:MYXO-CTERM domain-containing protein